MSSIATSVRTMLCTCWACFQSWWPKFPENMAAGVRRANELGAVTDFLASAIVKKVVKSICEDALKYGDHYELLNNDAIGALETLRSIPEDTERGMAQTCAETLDYR